MCVAEFDLRSFLCSESEQLIWKSEGLPSDDLSMENALVILQVGPSLPPPWSHACPLSLRLDPQIPVSQTAFSLARVEDPYHQDAQQTKLD